MVAEQVSAQVAEHRHTGPDGRRHVTDRRVAASGAGAIAERRGKTVWREACVMEIPLAPLIGPCDRRMGDRRYTPPPPSPWQSKATHIVNGLSSFWQMLH